MSSMKLSYVDAFTSIAFSGNPAAVTLLEQEIPEELMQNIAREVNLSETAFLKVSDKGYSIRWFTPKGEVDLCGHATLAAAHYLWEKGHTKTSEISFESKSGILLAKREGKKIVLDFPIEAPEEGPHEMERLTSILNTPLKYVGKNRMDYLVEFPDEQTLKEYTPDSQAIASLGSRGLIITSRSDQYDFVSRCFFPNHGITEDPVTGSAHCALGPYWSSRLKKSSFHAYQGSIRGGELEVELKNDRVFLKGEAITTIEADLLINL